MKRRLVTKKVLVATLGVGAVSYVVACSSSQPVSGNLMPPQGDSGSEDAGADVSSSGNLMAPPDSGPADTGSADAGADVSTSGNLMAPPDSGPADAGADVSTSGNLMAPPDSGSGDASSDASDDGG